MLNSNQLAMTTNEKPVTVIFIRVLYSDSKCPTLCYFYSVPTSVSVVDRIVQEAGGAT